MARAQACDIIIDSKPTFGHCGIVTGIFAGKAATVPAGHEVLHATNSGVIEGPWGNGRAWVYRASTLSRTQAEKIQNCAHEIKGGASYGVGRAVFKSWSGSSKFGADAFTRLMKYRERMTVGNDSVLKNVYCSELVVVAYQLGTGIDKASSAWIDLDGKHTLPSTLKTWLDRNATKWTCVGVVTDDTLEISAP